MRLQLLIILLTVSCSVSDQCYELKRSEIEINDGFFSGKTAISLTSNGFKIALLDVNGEQLDRTIFNYRPYQLDTADVNHDGKTEVLVGLIKTTQFDPQQKRRLFILRIDDGQLRPLWLGSKVCQQLVDFKALSHGIVKTLEKTKNGNYAVGRYEWQGFGLTLIDYIDNEKPHDEAIEIFGS